MRKADRLFQLVNLIRVHQPISAQRLAERLGVSVRSVYRYIDDLSLSGVPLYGEPGRGYALRPGFELPPLSLDEDELAALLLGTELLTRSTGPALAAAARSLLAKLGAALPAMPDPASAPLRAPLLADTQTPTRHWDALHDAIRHAQAVRLHYLDGQQRASERLLRPLGLFYWGGKWTVGGWCLLREDYRDFRLDRIQHLQRVPDPVPLPAGVDLQRYLRHQALAWQRAAEQ
ncbi:YafY family protein [Pseudomonas sp. CAU 1711]|uniref:helix-turn-helix transcriptional regulator n=1 Tax=Pseudomonas sp. CAU 1711 TaxID=3140356 RepID=UPI003261B6E7